MPSDNEEEISTHIHQQRQVYNEDLQNFESKDVEDRRLRRLMQHKEQGDIEERYKIAENISLCEHTRALVKNKAWVKKNVSQKPHNRLTVAINLTLVRRHTCEEAKSLVK